MGKTYVNEQRNLSFKIILDDLKFIIPPLLDFNISSKELIFISDGPLLSFENEKPFDEVIDNQILGLNISSKDLKFINISTILPTFLINSSEPDYINNSKTLSFKLDDFDSSIPAFQIVLEFFNETGGVF